MITAPVIRDYSQEVRSGPGGLDQSSVPGLPPGASTMPAPAAPPPTPSVLPFYQPPGSPSPQTFLSLLQSLYGGNATFALPRPPGTNQRGVAPPAGSVWEQLAAGFTRAGAPGLAQMALNQAPAMSAWLRQESGLRPGAVSPANNQGLPNGGLFQFWEGHPWTRPFFQGNRFTMPVAMQAQDAVRYFGLTPDEVRRYAAQIRAGSYRGWG